MSKMYGKMLNTGNGAITAIIDSHPYTVDKTHQNYVQLLNAFHKDDADAFLENYDVQKAVQTFAKAGGLEVTDSSISYRGEVLHDTLATTILELKRNGHPIDYMVKFLENVLQNPSMESRRQMYDFLKHRNMPITTDGCFIAYKAVDSQFWSIRGGSLKLVKGKVGPGGKVFNGIGEVIECERRDVDDNRRNECSYGLHVGALSYSGPNGSYGTSGGKTILVKVNPKDVIAVPEDYNAAKMRVCCYEVVAEFKAALTETVYGKVDSFIVNNCTYTSPEDIIAEYDEDGWDDDYEDDSLMPDAWADLCEGDVVVVKDAKARIPHSFEASVTHVEEDCVVLTTDIGHVLEVADYEAEDDFILEYINKDKV